MIMPQEVSHIRHLVRKYRVDQTESQVYAHVGQCGHSAMSAVFTARLEMSACKMPPFNRMESAANAVGVLPMYAMSAGLSAAAPQSF